jgi:hypothetical protein
MYHPLDSNLLEKYSPDLFEIVDNGDGSFTAKSKKRITQSEFDDFCLEYIMATSVSKFARYRHLRFGQAFMNEKFPLDIFPTLFYCSDDSVAVELIQDTYLLEE